MSAVRRSAQYYRRSFIYVYMYMYLYICNMVTTKNLNGVKFFQSSTF